MAIGTLANSGVDVYGRTAKLDEARFRERLGESLGRWDRRMGAAYAGLANRRMVLILGRAFALFVLIMLVISKWQMIGELLGTNRSPHDLTAWMNILNQALQMPFMGLLLLLMIIRRPARAGTARLSGIPPALAGTVAPLFLAVDSNYGTHAAMVPLGIALLLVGIGWSIWSLMVLGRCFSILPEVRGLVTSGPYRWVRHPVYLGEITSTLGLLLPVLSPFNVLVFALFCALQLWRTRNEEANLAANFPEYGDYRLRTARLLPGLW